MVFNLIVHLSFDSFFTTVNLTDTIKNLCRTAGFKHIAFSTSFNDWINFFIVQIASQNQNLGFRPFFEQFQSRLNTIQFRHNKVHNDDIRTQFQGKIDTLSTIPCLPNYFYISLEIQETLKAQTDHLMVIDQNHINLIRHCLLLLISAHGHQ